MKTFAFNFYPYERKAILNYLYEKQEKGYILHSFNFKMQTAKFIQENRQVYYDLEIRENNSEDIDKHDLNRQEFLDTCYLSGWEKVHSDQGVTVFLSKEKTCPVLLFDHELSEELIQNKKKEFLEIFETSYFYRFVKVSFYIYLFLFITSFLTGNMDQEVFFKCTALFAEYGTYQLVIRWMKKHIMEKDINLMPFFPVFMYMCILSFTYIYSYPLLVAGMLIFIPVYIIQSFKNRNSFFVEVCSKLVLNMISICMILDMLHMI